MKLSQAKYQEIDAKIGRLLAIYPNITGKKIADTLGYDHNFILKRVNKIWRKHAEDIKRMTVEEDLGEIRNFINSTLPEIAKIIFNNGEKDANGRWIKEPASDKDKIGAMRVLMESKKTFMDKKFDAGIFERQLGKIVTDNSLGEAERELIKTALNYAWNADKPTKEDTGGSLQQ